jgi:hypothetical protein
LDRYYGWLLSLCMPQIQPRSPEGKKPVSSKFLSRL